MQKEGTAYIGIDESNHGRFPEIFVGVYSHFPSDTSINFYERIKPPSLFARLAKRNWRYLIVSETDYKNFGPHEIKVYTATSLITALNPQENFLEIFVDGELRRKEREEIKEIITKTLNLTFLCVEVRPLIKSRRGKYQKTNHITLLADSLANYLYRQKTLEELVSGKISKRKASLLVD